jgi:hypothetical protein
MRKIKILAVILLWLASMLRFLSSIEANPTPHPWVTRTVSGCAFVGLSLVGWGMVRKCDSSAKKG